MIMRRLYLRYIWYPFIGYRKANIELEIARVYTKQGNVNKVFEHIDNANRHIRKVS